MRRYMCSYNAPDFLFPPQELIAIAGALRTLTSIEVSMLDAIAEGTSEEEVERLVARHDVVVSLCGFECFEEDMQVLERLKSQSPTTTFILFGHYATLFPEEILRNTSVDFVLIGEPDLNCLELVRAISSNTPLDNLKGVAYLMENDEIYNESGSERIGDPSVLPMPAYDLLKFNLYSEPFMPKPFALIQTARGCPYQCNFCVKSFGTKLGLRRAEDILDEIDYLVNEHGVRAIRFIDDTFTAIPSRVTEICNGIIERDLKVSWTCLSRLDTLEEQTVRLMKASGCVRLNVGIESGSLRMLEKYNKQLDLEKGKNMLLYCSSIGLETLGFFMVGHPDETEEELRMSIEFAKSAKLNFAVVGELIPYPGTKLFAELEDKLEFSLFPYLNRFKDTETEMKYLNWEKRFYREFYMRPSYVLNHLKTQVIRGKTGWGILKEVIRFLSSKGQANLRRDFI